MQQLLVHAGSISAKSDGRFGPKTRAAIRDFQARAGLVPDGFPQRHGAGAAARELDLRLAMFSCYAVKVRQRPV